MYTQLNRFKLIIAISVYALALVVIVVLVLVSIVENFPKVQTNTQYLVWSTCLFSEQHGILVGMSVGTNSR